MLVYIIAAAILFLGVILRQGAAFYWIGYAFLFIITVFRDPVLGATDTIIYQDFSIVYHQYRISWIMIVSIR